MPILQFKVHSNYDEVIRLRTEIERLETTLKGFGPGTAEATIRGIEQQLSRARAEFRKLADDAIRSGGDVEKGLRTSLRQIQNRSKVNVSISADNTDFRKANAQVMRDIDDSLRQLQMYGQQMNGLFSRFAGLTGLTVAGMGVMEFANQVKNARGEFQQYEVAFETMLGSSEKAKNLMAELTKTAAITPFDLSGVTNGAKQLLAYGIASEDVNNKLIQLGDIAAGLSLPLGDLVYLYGTTMTQGRMFTQDLRQFQGRGIPIAKELAKQFGVAEKEVGGLVTAGKVTAKEFKAAIESMAGSGGQFGGLMEKQSQTITGQISNIEDATVSMFNEIGQSSEGIINLALQGTGSLIENWKTVGTTLALVATAFAGFKLGDVVNTKLFDQQMDETMARLRELERTAKDFKLDDDIKQAVDKGVISASDATEYQSARDKLRDAGAEDKTLAQLQEEANRRVAVAEAMELERQKLAEINAEEEKRQSGTTPMELDTDLQTHVSEGLVSTEDAENLQQMRNDMADLVAEKQKALDAATQEVLENTELNQLCQQAVSDAQDRLDVAQRTLDSLQEQYDLQEAGATDPNDVDSIVTELDLQAAARERDAAAAELQRAQVDAQSSAEMVNESVTRQNTIANEAQAISRESEAAATATSTAATNANSASQGTNTAAITRNTIASKLGAAWDKTAAGAKLIFSNAIKSVTASLHAMKVAIMTNPIGMLITALTTVIGLFMAFNDSTEEASEEVTRFGEAAVKTKNNADTLYAVLATVSKESKTYKDALSELEKVAKEYGITLDAEKDKYDQLIEKRAQLIQLIMEEGRQRQIANNIAAIQKQKEDATEEFRKELTENINDETDDEQVKASTSVLVATWVDKIEDKRADLVNLINELDAKERELALERAKGEYQDYTKTARLQSELTQQRNELMSEMNADARKIMEAQGKKIGKDWQLDTNDAYQSLRKLVIASDAANKAMDGYVQNQQENAAKLAQVKVEPPIDYTKVTDVKELSDAYTQASARAKELAGQEVKPEADPINIHALFEEAEKAQSKIADVDNSSATPSTDNTNLDETQVKAAQAEDKINDVDNAVATPYIDTKYLDIALNTLDKIKITLRDVGGQVLNTTGAERETLQALIAKYGKDGKIAPGTKMAKADADAYNAIVRKSRLRSNFKLNGTNHQLNGEQSALLQQFIDRYGTKLSESKMSDVDKRLYRQFVNDLQVSAYNKDKSRQTQIMKDVKTAFDKRLKDAKSTEDFDTLRKEIQAQQKTLDQNSDLYKYFETYLKNLDKKDKSKKNNKSGSKDDPKQRAYEVAKAEAEEAKRLAELKAKAEQDAKDLAIATMADGTEKEIAQIHNDAKKKRDALIKERQKEADKLKQFDLQQWLKAGRNRKAYQWKQTKTDAEYLEEAGENIDYDGQLSEIAFNESSDLRKAYHEELTAMRDYLKEYGTFEQRKLAIALEYAKKIAEARNEGERLTFESERDKAIENVEAQAITAKIDWYSVFDNVGIVMKGQLQPLYEQLQSYVQTDAFRQSGAENQRTVIEAMQKLREQLGTSDMGWQDLASAMTTYQQSLNELREATDAHKLVLEEQQRLNGNVTSTEAALKLATENLAKGTGTQADVDIAQTAYENAVNAVTDFGAKASESANAVQTAQNKVTSSGMMLSQTANNVMHPIDEISTFLTSSSLPQLGELYNAFQSLKGSINALKAIKEASKDIKDGTKDVSSVIAEAGKKRGEILPKSITDAMGKAGVWGQLISAVLSILDILKDGIGTLISSIIDTVLQAISGLLDNILSGEFLVQIGESLVKGIGGIFKSITTLGGLFDWWGNGDSDPHLEEDVERLTLTNEALRKAIEDLTDEMKGASIGDAKAKYNDAKTKYEQSVANTQKMMRREGAAYSNGFLGIGGHHSSNHKVNEAMSKNEWSRISSIIGRTIGSAGEFWSITSEQMAKVRKEAPDLYAKIKQYADNGYKDASQYMDQYADYYEELEQLHQAYVESLTDVSLDSVKDEFKSLLTDMESDAEDFAENFEKMMQQAVINAFVNELFASKLEDWYDHFAKAMESDEGLSKKEMDDLQKEWDGIVNDALKQRDELAKAMGWDTSATQQSSSRTLSGMSQDTADAIEGRLTAIQIATESIRAAEQSSMVSLAQITESALSMMMKNNQMSQHYENIEQQIAKCYLELVAISENTGAIVKPIQEMRGFLNEMNKNIKNL